MKRAIHILLIIFSITILASCTTPVDSSPRASMGSKTASVVIDEFSDFECPYCSTIGNQVLDIVKRNSNNVRLDFYHFPLTSIHKNAFKAAEAAECANEQGKFWEYAKMNFANQKSLTEDNLKLFASKIKLDTAKFNKCLDNSEKKSKIKSDMQEGIKRGVKGTPNFYVNGKFVQYTGAENFEKYIKSLIK